MRCISMPVTLLFAVGDDTRRRDQQLELDALFFGLVDLGVMRGHLLARTAVEHRDFTGALTHRGAAGVHGGEAAADDGDLVADPDFALTSSSPRKSMAETTPGRPPPGMPTSVAVEGAEGEEHSVVLVLLKAACSRVKVDTQTDVALQLDAEAPEHG